MKTTSQVGQTYNKITAQGIIDFSDAQVRDRYSVGIKTVRLLSLGQIEVVFDDPHYISLKSTVIISSCGSIPVHNTWETFGSDSVRVRVWKLDGTPSLSGRFSILLIHDRD